MGPTLDFNNIFVIIILAAEALALIVLIILD